MQVVAEEPLTVLLVGAAEPHLAAVLRAGGFTVVEAAADAVAVDLAAAADAVVVDLDGPGGRNVTEAIEALAAAPVLALSAADSAAVVLAAVRAGAAGYLVRTGGATALVDAVRRTAAGEAVFTPGLAAAVLDQHAGGGADGLARLTEREADVLRMVVAGYTARQIAGRLVLSPRTVENHVQHMLRKLGVPNRAALVRHAIENGLA